MTVGKVAFLLTLCVPDVMVHRDSCSVHLLHPSSKEESLHQIAAPTATVLIEKEDRYGGVVIEVPDGIRGDGVAHFESELWKGLGLWRDAGKKGLWLKIPLTSADCVGPAARGGFQFHHAKPTYVMLTQWLPESPSTLPGYAFTTIGVGGVVVNSKGEVLVVQEKIAQFASMQGSWKLPGGAADPEEDFETTVVREVQEETSVTCHLLGITSVRHNHGFPFGQDDIYVVAKLQADVEEIKIDTKELSDAQWMLPGTLEKLVKDPREGGSMAGKVPTSVWMIIQNGLKGHMFAGQRLPRGSMLYSAK